MRVLVFDYIDRYDFDKDFVSSEEDFYDRVYLKKYDAYIINFDFYPQFVEVKDYIDSYVIFITEVCDEFIYKKALRDGDFCYSYNEIFKLKIRLEYLEKKITKLNTRVFKYKDLVFNLNTNQLYKNSQPIKLTKAETDLLKALIKYRNKYLSKEDIESVCESIDSINSIKVLISNLRKIGFDIENIKNLGYKLKEES